MDSLAPARSALRPSVSPNSFRRFPNGSSRVKAPFYFPSFARKTFNPWAGLKTDSRSAAGHWTARCRSLRSSARPDDAAPERSFGFIGMVGLYRCQPYGLSRFNPSRLGGAIQCPPHLHFISARRAVVKHSACRPARRILGLSVARATRKAQRPIG